MAFEFAGLMWRNPSWVTRNARGAWITAKAMKNYRKKHPVCAWCGRDARVQIHHIHPVSVRPNLAADPNNMLTLCAKRCHLCVGHNGDYGGRYVLNLVEVCVIREVWEIEKPDG